MFFMEDSAFPSNNLIKNRGHWRRNTLTNSGLIFAQLNIYKIVLSIRNDPPIYSNVCTYIIIL